MLDLAYWVRTFLSNPAEWVALQVTLGIFAAVGGRYSEERDARAVAVGIVALVVFLAAVGPRVVGQWHYWAGGSLLGAFGVITVDNYRAG